MLSLHSISILRKTNPRPGLLFNNKHLKLLRRPFPLDLFSSSLMSHNLSLSWLMPPCLLLVQFFFNWHQWRPPPLCLFLLHLSSCGMELQHLHTVWSGTPSSYSHSITVITNHNLFYINVNYLIDKYTGHYFSKILTLFGRSFQGQNLLLQTFCLNEIMLTHQ